MPCHRDHRVKKIYANADGTLRFTHNGAVIARVNVPEHARRLAAAWNEFLEAETTAIESVAEMNQNRDHHLGWSTDHQTSVSFVVAARTKKIAPQIARSGPRYS